MAYFREKGGDVFVKTRGPQAFEQLGGCRREKSAVLIGFCQGLYYDLDGSRKQPRRPELPTMI